MNILFRFRSSSSYSRLTNRRRPSFHQGLPIILVQYATLNPTRAMAHVTASSGNDIRPYPIQATRRLPKRDPRRSDQDRLPANGMHVLVLHAAQCPRANSHTYNYCIWRSRLSGNERSVDDLLDVLHRRADVLPAGGHKCFIQPVEVVGRVDGNRGKLQSGFKGRRRKGFRWGDFKLRREYSRSQIEEPKHNLTSGITSRTDGPKSGSTYNSV